MNVVKLTNTKVATINKTIAIGAPAFFDFIFLNLIIGLYFHYLKK